MAAVIGALRAVLSAQIAEFTSDMGRAANSVDGFQRNFTAAGRAMQGAGAAMSAAVTAPLVALGTASTAVAAEFESSMSNVATLVDTASESIDDMGREVLDVSRRTPVAISGLTSALYDVRSAGIAAGDAMNVLEGSARLGVAGLGSTSEAVDLVTSSINAFNLEGEEQARVYDVIFKTVQSGKTTLSELSQGFGAVAGTVANAGVEIDEYLASVSALTTTGLPAAQAHTQLRAAIAGLTRETSQSREVFAELGARDFPDLIEKSGGMVAAFQRVVGALDGNDAAIINLLGSVEAYNAVIGLTGRQNEAFSTTLADMRSGVSAVDTAFETQNATLASAQQRMSNAMESMSISIGTVLAPTFEKLANFLASLANAFGALSPEMQAWIVTLGAVAAAVGPVLLVLGTLMTSLSGLAGIVPAVSAAASGIGAALALMGGPITLVIAAVAALAAAWLLYGDQIAAAAQAIYTAVDAALGGRLTGAIEAVKAVLDGFVEHLRLVFQMIGQIFTGDFAGALETLQQIWENAWTTVKAFLDGLLPGIVDTLTGFSGQVLEIVSNLVTGIGTWLVDRLTAIFNSVGDGVREVAGWFQWLGDQLVFHSIVPDMIDGIAREFARLPSVMVTPAQTAANAVESAFSATVDTLSGLFDKLLTDGKLTFDDLKSAALELAKQLFMMPFFNALKGSFGGGGGLGALFAGMFANGGTIPRGQWGIVGERGPEPVFAGNADLTVLPNSALGGGKSVTQVFNITTPNADSFRASQRQISRMARQRLQV